MYRFMTIEQNRKTKDELVAIVTNVHIFCEIPNKKAHFCFPHNLNLKKKRGKGTINKKYLSIVLEVNR